MKGAITFRFECEDDHCDKQAQGYWKAMIEASRPTTVVKVTDVIIQLRVVEHVEP